VAEPVAIHPWHENVREDRIDPFMREHFQSVDTIGCFDDPEPFGLKLDAEQFAISRYVIDDKDVHGF
jgi:hypothetical protein